MNTSGLRSDEGGFTLVEVLMTMVLASLLGGAIVTTVASVARGSAAANNRIRATEQVQVLSDRLSKYLRAAHPLGSPAAAFAAAGDTTFTVYTDVGDPTGPRQVTVSLTGASPQQTMSETVTVPAADGTYPGGGATTKVLASQDVDASAPMFTYYDANGLVLTPTTAAIRAQINRVRLTLTIREGGTGGPTTVDSLVYLRNVEYR